MAGRRPSPSSPTRSSRPARSTRLSELRLDGDRGAARCRAPARSAGLGRRARVARRCAPAPGAASGAVDAGALPRRATGRSAPRSIEDGRHSSARSWASIRTRSCAGWRPRSSPRTRRSTRRRPRRPPTGGATAVRPSLCRSPRWSVATPSCTSSPRSPTNSASSRWWVREGWARRRLALEVAQTTVPTWATARAWSSWRRWAIRQRCAARSPPRSASPTQAARGDDRRPRAAHRARQLRARDRHGRRGRRAPPAPLPAAAPPRDEP